MPNFDTNVLGCTPREGQIPPDHPTHRYDYNDVDKDDNIKNDLDGDVFNPKGKTNGFLFVFIGLGWSTFKDDQLEEKNYNNDFQSEGKNQWFFSGFAMTMKLHDFITDCSISIRRGIPMFF